MSAQNKLIKAMMDQQADWLRAEKERLTLERERLALERAKQETTTLAKPKIFDMVSPMRFCGRAKELDKFLDALRSNFNSHKHLFPRGGPDQVHYAISLLDSWSNHSDPTQRQTSMTDPSEWASDLRADSDPCLEDFDLFAEEIYRIYGDKDRRNRAVMKMLDEYIQLPNEPVRTYANRIKANWRQAGWNLPELEIARYDMAWGGLRHHLKNKIGPMTPKSGRFESIEELFDKAAASEVVHTQSDGKKPGGQQKQPESSYKGGKRTYRPSISDPSGTTQTEKSSGGGGGKSKKHGKPGGGGNRSNLPPAPWTSKDVYDNRRANQQCTRCGSKDHKTYHCTRYSKPNMPELDSNPGGGGHQVKRQKSFDTQQSKNSHTSPGT
jgi:hypothetical protein